MADLRAEQIMAACVTLLTGLTTTENRVYRDDPYSHDDNDCPFITVMLGDDEPDQESITFGHQSDIISNLAVSVAATVKNYSGAVTQP